MRWSWKVGDVAGVTLRVHATTILLLAWLTASYLTRGSSLAALGEGLAFSFCVVGSIVLHAAGRILTAKALGVTTPAITLLPTGGVARFTRALDVRQEVIVALSGSGVNAALAALLFGAAFARGDRIGLGDAGFAEGTLLANLAWANLFIAAFNLLPAFPADGGRVLRSVLQRRFDQARATDIVATIGVGLSLVLAFLGLTVSPLLVFVAFVVWVGAADEGARTQVKSIVSGFPASRAMVGDFVTLSPEDSLDAAVGHVRGGFRHDFPVAHEGKLVGLLTRSDLLLGLVQHGRQAPVSEAMQTKFATVDATETLERALTRLTGPSALPVLDGVRLVGILTLDSVGELVAAEAGGTTDKGKRLRALLRRSDMKLHPAAAS